MSLELRDVERGFRAAVMDGGAEIAGLLRGDATAGLGVYRATVRGSLAQILATAFPVTQRVAGAAFFAGLADRFVVAHPPRVPQLSAYGAGFADFIAGEEVARRLPYLADVARLEWARSESYFAADAAALNPARLAKATPEEMEAALLRLHPATRLVESRFPLVRIWGGNQPHVIDVPAVDLGAAETALVSRRGMELVTRAISRGDTALVKALAAGKTLGDAATIALSAEPEFNLRQALQDHFTNGTFAEGVKEIHFRALSRSDYPTLVRWLAEPHVDAWWHQALDLAGVAAKYDPRIDKTDPTHVFIVEFRTQPIGWIQWYRWSDYPKHARQLDAGVGTAGIDLAIGEQGHLGQGIGPAIIRTFLKAIVSYDPAVNSVIVDVEEKNVRSVRAFEKVGFLSTGSVQLEGEQVYRKIMRLGLSDLT